MTNSLFNPEWTIGNLDKISWLTQYFGALFVIILSVSGFLMSTVPIIDFILYVTVRATPKIWDRVDEAHRLTVAEARDAKSNNIQKVVGTVAMIVFNFLPNLKDVTEADEIVNHKTHMIQKFTLMIFLIFLGSVIYYGYFSAVGQKASEMGITIVDSALDTVDPKIWAEKLNGTLTIIDLNTDGSKLEFDKAVNKITKKGYGSLSSSTKMSADAKKVVALEIESWVDSELESLREFTNTNNYSMSVTTKISRDEPKLAGVDNVKVEDVTMFTFFTPVSTFSTGLAESADVISSGSYLVVTLQFKDEAKEDIEELDRIPLIMMIPNEIYSADTTESTIQIDMTNSNKYQTVFISKIDVVDNAAADSKKMSLQNNRLILEREATNLGLFTSATTSGIKYKDGNTSHPIVQIIVDDNIDQILFVPQGNYEGKVTTFELGGSPERIEDVNEDDQQ